MQPRSSLAKVNADFVGKLILSANFQYWARRTILRKQRRRDSKRVGWSLPEGDAANVGVGGHNPRVGEYSGSNLRHRYTQEVSVRRTGQSTFMDEFLLPHMHEAPDTIKWHTLPDPWR